MKIAYCVQCHKINKVIIETVNRLSEDKDNHIYVHVDKKSDLSDFKVLKEKVVFINERIDVRWGDFSQVKATLNSLKEVKDGGYDYIFLISGDCLPLKTNKYIKEYLKERKGTEFIGVERNNDEEYIRDRVRLKYYSIDYVKEKGNFSAIVVDVLDKFKLRGKNKEFKNLPKIYKGSNWFTISGDFCNYIFKYLEENPKYLSGFKNSMSADECFFQSILMDSPFKEKLVDYNEDDCLMSLRYIDWTTGPEYPRVLDSSDFTKMYSLPNALFGRKFNDDLDFEEYRKLVKENFKC